MCYPVYWVGHIKEPLLLIGKSSPCSGGSRFPLSLSEWSFTICPTVYNCTSCLMLVFCCVECVVWCNVYIQSKLLQHKPAMDTHSLSAGLSVNDSKLIVSL